MRVSFGLDIPRPKECSGSWLLSRYLPLMLRRRIVFCVLALVAIVGTTILLEILFSSSGRNWNAAVTAVSTIVVASATVYYAFLTRQLVAQQEKAMQRSNLAEINRARVEFAHHLNADLDRKLRDARTATLPIANGRVLDEDSVAGIRKIEECLIEIAAATVDGITALPRQDLLLVTDISKRANACATDYINVEKAARDCLSSRPATAETDSQPAKSLTWSDAKGAYYTKFRKPGQVEWQTLVSGEPLEELAKAIMDVVIELRGRAGLNEEEATA